PGAGQPLRKSGAHWRCRSLPPPGTHQSRGRRQTGRARAWFRLRLAESRAYPKTRPLGLNDAPRPPPPPPAPRCGGAMRIDGATFRASILAIPLVAASACGPRRDGGVPKVPVSVARVERRALPYELEATGTVEPIRSVDVLPQVNGTILRVRFGEGDEVAAGQVLFEIDPRPYQAALQQAEGALLRDLTQAASAAREAARY